MNNLDAATRPLARASQVLARSLAGPNPAANTPDASGRIAGFRLGLWHGAIAPVAFVVSLFNDRVHVFEVHNNGKLYLLGFILGITAIWGSRRMSSAGRAKRDRGKPTAAA